MIPPEAIERARTMLSHATRPLFFHDDDCDGTTSFVICYQFCKEGTSYPVKRSPSVGPDLLRKVEEVQPDLIVILDKPKVDPEFLQGTRTPILWIDHHEPQTAITAPHPNVFYLNPRIWDDADNRPTSYWSYQITKTNLWLATVGSVGDWHLPDYLNEFRAQYPDLAPAEYRTVEEAYLDSPIGTLVRVIQFNLKGATADAKKSVLTLTRIESPYEILGQQSSRGKFLWKKYEKLAGPYAAMLEEARAQSTQPGKVLLYLYENEDTTFTGELSNELLIRYPDRVIFIGRKNGGYVKASVRSKGIELPTKIAESVKGLDGYGGGHKHACGLVVNESQWGVFWERFTKLVEE
jgi:single-stranded DNA-specific DHH superfamily exonuclease